MPRTIQPLNYYPKEYFTLVKYIERKSLKTDSAIPISAEMPSNDLVTRVHELNLFRKSLERYAPDDELTNTLQNVMFYIQDSRVHVRPRNSTGWMIDDIWFEEMEEIKIPSMDKEEPTTANVKYLDEFLKSDK